MKNHGNYERLRRRYEEGEVPWDDTLPPPEVQAEVKRREPGRALDLGCGYGRASIYLAEHGWQVDGVDFVELALQEAARRATAAGVSVTLHHGSTTDLSFLTGAYDLALDVGCGHGLDEEGWRSYHAELRRLLNPGALFLFFARIQQHKGEGEDDGPRGLDEDSFRQLFSKGFVIYRYEPGVTEMAEEDGRWTSAWFWLCRLAD